MKQYVSFFFGTPQRFLVVIITLFILVCAFNMNAVELFFQRLLHVLANGVVPCTLIILVIFFGFKMVLGGFGNHK